MRLRRRIFLTYLSVSLLLVAVAGGLLCDSVRDEARAGVRARLETGLRLVAADLEGDTGSANAARLDARLDALGRAADERLTLIGPDGRVLADSEFDGAALAGLDNHNGRAEVRQARAVGEGESARYSRSVDVELLYRARRIDSGPWAGGVVRMAVPLTRVADAQRAAGREVALAIVLALGLALAAGALWARRLTRPLAELRATAARVVAGDLSARARIAGTDEVGELAAALNTATARLAERIAVATRERDQLEAVVEGMAEGVLVTDAAGRVALANPALHAIFGLERPVLGRTVLEALRHPAVAGAIEQAAAGPSAVTLDAALGYPAEKGLTLHAVGLASGGAVGVFHDVTALRRVERVRKDFVANVSHEIQTPLATLAGYAEALEDPALDAQAVREHAVVIRRHVARLSALVADLLALSRLEAEGFAPVRSPVAVDELLESLAPEWRDRAAARGQTLRVNAPRGLVVPGDRRLLRQALANLLENAVKYAPPGADIFLRAGPVPEGVELVVTDTGPGIPIEDQARIFERFYRVEKGRSRDAGGTGLGLSIVKHVAEVHGGTASVESVPGTGATFRLTLPV